MSKVVHLWIPALIVTLSPIEFPPRRAIFHPFVSFIGRSQSKQAANTHYNAKRCVLVRFDFYATPCRVVDPLMFILGFFGNLFVEWTRSLSILHRCGRNGAFQNTCSGQTARGGETNVCAVSSLAAVGARPTINLSTPPVASFFVLRTQTHDFHYAELIWINCPLWFIPSAK